ncbi:T9SS type A sorting domain-containing protein [Flavobacterium zepuense]|uniref:T9SS type A sorting domain-containing protein n=1 Tax=Flavobacterium zepuense TaxID=2593302 RepID=A0A552UXR1_9FLAO|nr:T9SS type A sorting domain-containing protein [Flavobacterium zepuense]TRW23021.1 T9SS type A sorting domain-containing protein [Flavobacterium zepuense]
MKKKTTFLLPALLLLAFTGKAHAQCASASNIYTFTYNGAQYEIVKEKKRWLNAAQCALERGGYLAEINDAAEQNAINAQIANAGIDIQNTKAADGGNASYVWIGGNDISTEGAWMWNGNLDAVSVQFWEGDASGHAVNNLYTNWGNEPDDNAIGGQDGLGLAITNWPLGLAGQWNDIKQNNVLYYIIEYNALPLGVSDKTINNQVLITPNPATDIVTITSNHVSHIERMDVYNTTGQQIKTYTQPEFKSGALNVSQLQSGLYIIQIQYQDGASATKKLVKQ